MRRFVPLLLAAPLVLAACSSSSHATSTGPTSSTAATTASSATTATTAPTSSTTGAAKVGSGQKITVTPSTGLTSPAHVHVLATGFSPKESLIVIECANRGAHTAASECNLQAAKSVTSSSSGVVDTTFTVEKGPFGTAGVICSKPDSCIVSVTQATPSPTQEADTPISFS